MPSELPSHLVRLPGTRWALWRDCGLRSSGFPASMISALSDRSLADAARVAASARLPSEAYLSAYQRGLERSAQVLLSFVADPRFREAVAWQNPAILRGWMSALARSGNARKLFKSRYRNPVASYAQRYAVKNDTIGFFGPVSWVRLDETQSGVEIAVGRRLLSIRTVFFECWAVDELARALSGWEQLRPWIRPRLVAGCHHSGVVVIPPYGLPITLTPEVVRLIQLCDGSRTARQIAGELGQPEAAVIEQLSQWQDQQIVHFDLLGPIESRPEVTLRTKLGRVADVKAREAALGELGRLEAARDRLTAARDQPELLATRMTELDQVFEDLTGSRPRRRDGQAYAGRTLVYEDTVRDLRMVLGHQVLERLSAPLGMILDAASWLISRAGEALEEELRRTFERYRTRTGAQSMPLPELLARATRYLHMQASDASPLPTVREEFQRRWSSVLGPMSGSHHRVRSPDIAEAAARAFPASPAPWPGAVHVCPDLMVAATDPAAMASGDCQFVLGELHLANNTLQVRPFVEQHGDRAGLIAAIEADYPRQRFHCVPTRRWPQVNSRTYPGALLPPSSIYWCLHDDSGGAAGPVRAAAAMTVHLHDDGLVVVNADDGVCHPIVDVLDEQLSWAVVNLFEPVPRHGHQPRISIDDLVVHRESWTVNPVDLGWARLRAPAERYRMAQRWRSQLNLPERVFYTLPSETKPCYLDFSSPALVDLFAAAVRSGPRAGVLPSVTVAEMLPDLDQLWLAGPDGQRYTSELRMVAVNRGA